MRLVYRRDVTGRLQPVLENEHRRRLGRPRALVVARDPIDRIRLRGELDRQGYDVTTCPGPDRTLCPAAGLGDRCESRCPRVDPATEVIVLDPDAAATAVVSAYHSWVPDAEIRTFAHA